MRNPIDGEKMVPIFIGPMYYNRLSQLAEPKCYARAKGIMSKHTRQPTDGRSRNGGLRFGEMERDAIIALNLPHVLEDRLFYCSDAFWIHVCRKCNNVAVNQDMCLCGALKDSIQCVKMSFTSNLVFSLLKSFGAKVLFNLEDEKLEPVRQQDYDNEDEDHEDNEDEDHEDEDHEDEDNEDNEDEDNEGEDNEEECDDEGECDDDDDEE
jgi:hypothetical protein